MTLTVPAATKTQNDFSATRSPSLSYGTVLAGDILLAAFMCTDLASFNGTPPSPWALLDEVHQGSARSAAVYWKRATGSESGSETWTNLLAATETGPGIMFGIRDALETGSPFSIAGATETTSTGTAKDTASATPAHVDCLALALIGHSLARTFVWNATINEEFDADTSPVGGSNPGWFVGSKLLSGSPSTTLGGDASGSCASIEFLYFIRPAAGGGAPFNPIRTVV